MGRRIPCASVPSKKEQSLWVRRNELREVRIKIGAHCASFLFLLFFFFLDDPLRPQGKISYSRLVFFFPPLRLLYVPLRVRANSRSLISLTVQRGFAPAARRKPLSFSCIMPTRLIDTCNPAHARHEYRLISLDPLLDEIFPPSYEKVYLKGDVWNSGSYLTLEEWKFEFS